MLPAAGGSLPQHEPVAKTYKNRQGMHRQTHPARVVGTPNHPLQVARALVEVREGTVPAEVGLREGTLGALERHLPAVARRPGGAGRRPGLVGDKLSGGEARGEHGRARKMATAWPQRPSRQATGERQSRHQKHKRSGQKLSRVTPPSWTCASPTMEAVALLRPPKQDRLPAQHEPGARKNVRGRRHSQRATRCRHQPRQMRPRASSPA